MKTINNFDLNYKAVNLRKILGEDDESPINIFSLIEQIEGLTLINYPLSENISGMCVKSEGIKAILINSNMTYGRQKFSLAHELYHLYYDNTNVFSICSININEKDIIEKEADQFASYFIAPDNALRNRIYKMCGCNKLTLENVIDLEQYFEMSHSAMLVRLNLDGFINDSQKEKFSTSIRRNALQLGYKDTLYKPLDIHEGSYGHYIRQINAIRESKLLPESKINEFLLDGHRYDLVYGIDYKEG